MPADLTTPVMVRPRAASVDVAGLPVLHAHDDFLTDGGFLRCRICDPYMPPARAAHDKGHQ